VPLDPCGNPLPTAVVSPSAALPAAVVPAATYAPASAAAVGGAVTAGGTGAAAARPATAPPALSSADAEKAVSTFSEKPAVEQTKPESGWTDSPLDHVDPSTGTSAAGQAPAAPAGGDAIRLEKPTEPAAKPAVEGQGAAKRAASTLPAGVVETIPTPLPTPSIAAGQRPVAVVVDPPLVPVRSAEQGLPAAAVPPALPALQQRAPAAGRDAPRANDTPTGTSGQTT
jgi:hypothetical protein